MFEIPSFRKNEESICRTLSNIPVTEVHLGYRDRDYLLIIIKSITLCIFYICFHIVRIFQISYKCMKIRSLLITFQ